MASKPDWNQITKHTRPAVTAAVLVLAVVVAMLWLTGFFHHKVDQEPRPSQVQHRPVGDATLVSARIIHVPVMETSVGSIRPAHTAAVASRILAKVEKVDVIAGQAVRHGDILVELDSKALRQRYEQASAAVEAATARRQQAKIEADKLTQLLASKAATELETNRAIAVLNEAQAELLRNQQAQEEAKTLLEFATILSPIDGVVIDKKVEAGDTVIPGQVLATVYDPTHMQLVASVRESLSQRLKVGQTVDVSIAALNLECQGRIQEIVPEAEAGSRSFQVKVTGPCPPGVYSGMFGRLKIPLDDEAVLVIPQGAVRQVGQLHLIDVADGGVLVRRAIQLGRTFNDHVEVLSGLHEGEKVAIPPVRE